MRYATFVCTLIVLSLSRAAFGQGAPQAPAVPAVPEGPRVIVSYIEVAPSTDAQAVPLLRGYRDAARKAAGNTKADVLQRVGLQGHFVITEEWNDDASWKAHRGATHVTQFREKLSSLRVSPYDERSHTGLSREPAAAAPDSAVTVVTHVDVVPAGVPKAREMLQGQAMASRKEAGNLRFDILQGVRMNHFTVVESWRDQRAYDAHVSAAHTKTLRDVLQQLSPDAGLYDERLFRLGTSILDALIAGAPVAPVARYFEYWLLRLQGLYPEERGDLSEGAQAVLTASRTLSPGRAGALLVDDGVLREL